ncbi:MAG: HU family DNA-binding protein, partial [Parabacteroides sp.]|nr:HU family DNA-binding protein [Parabacteroides sp.]
MNKIELAKVIASRMSTTVTETLRFIDTMSEVISDSITHDESVLIQNFGQYMPWKQVERMGRNPRT